jgi:hypothetical protein
MLPDPLPLAAYQVSRDYEALWGLLLQVEVVCFVDYDPMKDGDPCRDVCSTMRYPEEGQPIQISARGVCYVYARTKAAFIKQCVKYNLEWLVPPPKKFITRSGSKPGGGGYISGMPEPTGNTPFGVNPLTGRAVTGDALTRPVAGAVSPPGPQPTQPDKEKADVKKKEA